jgi:hypothetical protein
MTKVLKWLVLIVLSLVLLLAAVAFALHQWLRTDDFRMRVEREATAALGVPLKLGRLSIDVWPLPAVAADQVRIQAQPPLTLERVEARPVWAGLMAGRLEISTLIVRKAVIPAGAVAAITAGMQKRKPATPKPAGASRGMLLPKRAVLDDVTWVDEKGQRITLDAQLNMGSDGLLDDASAKVIAGRLAGTKAQIKREGDEWPLRVDVGGGRITGKIKMQPTKAGAQLLTGQLATENVEVSALTAPSRTLTGKLQAQTTLRGEFREIGQLADVLQTQTRFTVRDAVIQGLDLVKAVETVGLSRGGLTQLDVLEGQVATQGRTVHVTNLVAQSRAMSATGNVTIAANRALNGKVNVSLVAARRQVEVPLQVSGTVDSPSVMLTREAMIGAAVGTIIAPGVGTGAGAATGEKLGDKLRGLFGR